MKLLNNKCKKKLESTWYKLGLGLDTKHRKMWSNRIIFRKVMVEQNQEVIIKIWMHIERQSPSWLHRIPESNASHVPLVTHTP